MTQFTRIQSLSRNLAEESLRNKDFKFRTATVTVLDVRIPFYLLTSKTMKLLVENSKNSAYCHTMNF
jgi:hypothetical protein